MFIAIQRYLQANRKLTDTALLVNTIHLIIFCMKLEKKETKKFVLEDFELNLSSSQINKTKIDGFKIDRSIEKKNLEQV